MHGDTPCQHVMWCLNAHPLKSIFSEGSDKLLMAVLCALSASWIKSASMLGYNKKFQVFYHHKIISTTVADIMEMGGGKYLFSYQ